MKNIKIPVDIHESKDEMVFVIPLGGVAKQSIRLSIQDYKLIISGKRIAPELRDDFLNIQEECYRGEIEQRIALPSHIVFDQIHSKLTKDNVLIVILPKYSVPEKIEVELE